MSNSLKSGSEHLANSDVICDICGDIGHNRKDAYGFDEGKLVLDIKDGATLYNWMKNKDEHLVQINHSIGMQGHCARTYHKGCFNWYIMKSHSTVCFVCKDLPGYNHAYDTTMR